MSKKPDTAVWYKGVAWSSQKYEDRRRQILRFDDREEIFTRRFKQERGEE